jgi:hypothetical protein
MVEQRVGNTNAAGQIAQLSFKAFLSKKLDGAIQNLPLSLGQAKSTPGWHRHR